MSEAGTRIKGFQEYTVFTNGSVYSDVSNKFLKPQLVNGYHHVTLGGQKGKQLAVHVIVAEAFICNRPLGMVVNHKNAIKTDNRAENLEWVTQSANVKHAYQLGLRVINQAHKDRCAALGRAKRKGVSL
jgi:hypothetical protein